VLRDQRPNSPEAIVEQEAQISDYERMRAELERIRSMVDAFTTGNEKKPSSPSRSKIFSEGVQNWWNKEARRYSEPGLSTWACSPRPWHLLDRWRRREDERPCLGALVGGKPVAAGPEGSPSEEVDEINDCAQTLDVRAVTDRKDGLQRTAVYSGLREAEESTACKRARWGSVPDPVYRSEDRFEELS